MLAATPGSSARAHPPVLPSVGQAAGVKAAYVRSMFGRVTPRYDRMNRLMTLGLDRRWRRMTARLARPRECLALDVGSGTGDLALELARQGARAVIGVDFCPEMIAVASDKLVPGRGRGRILLSAGDATRLPFAGDTFGCVASAFLLRNVADLEATLAEFHRVLAPGGRLACLELTHPRAAAGFLLRLYLSYWVPLLGAWVTGQADAYSYLSRSLTAFPDAERLARLMALAGLEQVCYRRLGVGAVAVHFGRKPRPGS